MTALETQRKMNTAYERSQYKKAFLLYVLLIDLKESEGQPVLRMPNLVQRAIDLKINVPAKVLDLQVRK